MKIKKNNGETIVETLVALLIIALCFLMLQTSIVTASKINKKAMEYNVSFKLSNTSKDITVTIDGNKVNNINGYISDGGYYYYE